MSNDLALIKKNTVDVVADKVKQFQEAGELHFPANYSPENAMKSAWLKMQSIKAKSGQSYVPVLQHCTKDSIANALLDMVVQGLNPSKNQGYFIAYGKSLTFQRSYFGTMAVTKRVADAKSIDATVIYEGDDVDYEMINGRVYNLKHKQKFGNINKENIIGAYCVINFEDDTYTELMTIDEIRQAWSKSQMWGKGVTKEKKGSTHDEFKQEMAKKTVINRACKKFINSSNDDSLVLDHFNRQDDVIEDAKAQQEIEQNANTEVIDIEPTDEPSEPKNDPSNKPKEPQQEPPAQNEQSNVNEVMEDMERKEKQTVSASGGPGF